MARCEYCEHYKKIYMPAAHMYTMGCELDKRSSGCKNEYVEKIVDTGKPKAFIKRRGK